jgi:hypothetical protein
MAVGVLLLVGTVFAGEKAEAEQGWISLFDGKSLEGWKASEKASSFSVRDGMICLESGRSHLFYVGPVKDHNFKNFEFKADVMTKPGSNSGIYFHTQYQERGWPGRGFECQVNNSHGDRKRTASLYNIKNIMNDSPAKDDVWFNYHIIVNGKTVTVKIDSKTVNEHTFADDARRKPSSGTFCLQAHDPRSKVYYKNIMVKPLPD